MLLTEKQKKALIHFMRLAISQKTAIALTESLRMPVRMEVSDLNLCPLSQLLNQLNLPGNQNVISIHQNFKGGISGDSILLWQPNQAIQLLNLLHIGQGLNITNLDLSTSEVLTEIGSILLSSYIGVLANINNYSLSFTTPYFTVESFDTLIKNLILAKNELRYVFLVELRFCLGNQCLPGYILLVANVMALSLFVKGIETSAAILIAEMPENLYQNV